MSAERSWAEDTVALRPTDETAEPAPPLPPRQRQTKTGVLVGVICSLVGALALLSMGGGEGRDAESPSLPMQVGRERAAEQPGGRKPPPGHQLDPVGVGSTPPNPRRRQPRRRPTPAPARAPEPVAAPEMEPTYDPPPAVIPGTAPDPVPEPEIRATAETPPSVEFGM